MKALRVSLLLAAAAGLAYGDSRDHLRGMLYRVDAQVLGLRLHPDQQVGEAQHLARLGLDTADELRKAGLPEAAASLTYESAALAAAARRNEPEDVRAHAIAVQRLVREVDDALPGPEITH